MKRRGTAFKTAESAGEQGFWPSYADMMSALALILFFLMLLSYIQNLITGNDLQNTQEVLASTRLEVSAAEDELAALHGEMDLLSAELDAAQITLDLQQEEIAGYSAKIDEQTEAIASQNRLISDQAAYLSAANDEILAMRNQMQTIAVLRLSILEQIRDSIADVMGNSSKVKIGDNGNIVLSEGVLFDSGSSQIKSGSSEVLDEMISVFSVFLSEPKNAAYVDSIVISGHTDSVGTDEANRVLSTDRANTVVNYLLSGQNGKLAEYAGYFCASGYGETRPVATNDTEPGRSANRRIEISIILKDDTILDIVDSYLAIEPPDSSTELNSGKAASAGTGT